MSLVLTGERRSTDPAPVTGGPDDGGGQDLSLFVADAIPLPAPDRSATLLAIEVDRWRLIRDLLGAGAAEVVTHHVAQAVRSAIRAVDRVFASGPGQFIVVLEGADHEEAERIALQVCRSLVSKSFADLGPATVSGAVAQRHAGESIGQWWKRLDSTLAQARAGGGDRIVVDRRVDDLDAEHAPGLVLEWQARFECGEPVIDRQHRGLFEQAEEVLDAARRGGPRTAEKAADLVLGISRHFATEESILAHYGYRALEPHRRAHAHLAEKAARMQAATAAGRATREDLLQFLLGEVVADHMLSEDRLFADLFARPNPPSRS
jgi:hemerythrin-like metal-binding protein/diguanylate cyclase (GGDEF)-like protein